MQACTTANKTVASLDNWSTAEFALLPRAAFVLLTNFLNRVEREGKWPKQLTIAKAAFLHKDDPANAGPLDARTLLILPTVYRRWASHRLQCIDSWVTKWQMPEMYAGVPGLSAEDAAYATSLELEDLNQHGTPYSGAVADIFKCFDQIVRPQVKTLLFKAGFPKRILEPYMAMLNDLIVHNLFAGHIGLGHQHHVAFLRGVRSV